jgi:hypothetical protein
MILQLVVSQISDLPSLHLLIFLNSGQSRKNKSHLFSIWFFPGFAYHQDTAPEKPLAFAHASEKQNMGLIINYNFILGNWAFQTSPRKVAKLFHGKF